jgi:hypothetical protein
LASTVDKVPVAYSPHLLEYQTRSFPKLPR